MKFSWPVRVYYEDTDSGGVVYYANYLKYYERGRTEYLRQLGFEQDKLIAEENIIFAVRNINVDYLYPAIFNDQLTVITEISEINKASLCFKQSIEDKQQKVLNTAVCKIACLSADGFKPKKLPDALVQQCVL